MPLSVSSAPEAVSELLTRAWQHFLVQGAGSDPDLDLPAGKKPKWTSHSLRRLGDTVARRYAAEMGVTEAQIDLYFGWHEKILLKNMQIHYSSLSIRERMALARTTGIMM